MARQDGTPEPSGSPRLDPDEDINLRFATLGPTTPPRRPVAPSGSSLSGPTNPTSWAPAGGHPTTQTFRLEVPRAASGPRPAAHAARPQTAPAQSAPAQSAPAQSASAQSAPAQPAARRAAPRQPEPSQAAPTQPAPTQPAPTQWVYEEPVPPETLTWSDPEPEAHNPYAPYPEPRNDYNPRAATPAFEFPSHAPARAPEESRWDIPPVPPTGPLSGADSLTADRIIRSRRATPQSGWRKAAYNFSGGLLNLGPSAADRERAHLEALARTHVTWCHRLAVISLKGGVGKTTTTAALGSMLAQLRGDRVIAVDANPDRGTLGERIPRESGATVRHLLQAREQIQGYSDVRKFTSQAPSRLEVLASDSDPSVSLAYSERDYRDTVATLERFYNLLITDCGTGLLHSAMAGILQLANSLVVVSSASLDGARSASATLDWLEAHGFEELASDAVVVISSVRPGSGMVDVGLLHDHFAARCREVVMIPYDPHLEAGGILDLGELKPATRQAYLELAAVVGDGLNPY